MSGTRGWGFLERRLSRWRFDIVLDLLRGMPSPERILDLGCGPHPHFLPLTHFKHRFGIDLNLREGVGLQGTRIDLLRCDLGYSNPPFHPGSFDAVTAIAFLEHLPITRGADLIRSVYELLRPNGVLVLTTPLPWTATVLKLMAALRLVSPQEIADHKAYYDRASIIKVLVSAGFPISGIRVGRFMAGANSWALARKE